MAFLMGLKQMWHQIKGVIFTTALLFCYVSENVTIVELGDRLQRLRSFQISEYDMIQQTHITVRKRHTDTEIFKSWLIVLMLG